MASGRSTPEYLTIVARTEDLRLVLQYDLVSVGASLTSCGLISPDQYTRSRNRMFTESERAADLVQWIQDKVQGNAQNYHTFIAVLQRDSMQYSHIVSKLQETYTQKQEGKKETVTPPPPPPADNQSSMIIFSPNLSDEEFMRYLKNEGLSARDCEIMKVKGIGAMVFATDFGDDDVSSSELNFSYGGKKVLRRLLKDRLASAGADGQAIEPIEFDENDKQQVSIDGGKIPVEHFEPYKIDRSTLRPVRFNFGVVKPKQGVKVSNIEEYDMSKFPHGIALIINNESFEGKEKRVGTAVDERHLTHAFRFLGYYVEVHREVDSERMLAIMTEMGKRGHDDYDSFVCCILSHGSAGHVFGTDDKKVSLNVLTQKIDAEHCPSLRNKPKLFFLQACRGNLTETSVPIGADGEIVSTPEEVPVMSDFFFGHATPLGHVAWRDLNHGSWYISELCYSLCEMSTYASLNDIMTKVNNRVSSGEKYKHIGYRMTPEVTALLKGNVFF